MRRTARCGHCSALVAGSDNIPLINPTATAIPQILIMVSSSEP
jgi:uncharacterized paraquat-inducible protein A